jgi:hypothetical protein
LQPHCIKLIDRKHTHTALRASFFADEPALAAPRCIGKRGVHDLNQLLIPGNRERSFHSQRIPIRQNTVQLSL